MGKKSRFGSGFLGKLKFFDADPDPGSGIFLTLDLRWMAKIRIRDEKLFERLQHPAYFFER
jgi:hypothetical protein